MRDPLDSLILNLLEWIGPGARGYAEVMEAWRTSCPRLPVWEEANELGLVEVRHSPGSEPVVTVSQRGAALLAEARGGRAGDLPVSAGSVQASELAAT